MKQSFHGIEFVFRFVPLCLFAALRQESATGVEVEGDMVDVHAAERDEERGGGNGQGGGGGGGGGGGSLRHLPGSEVATVVASGMWFVSEDAFPCLGNGESADGGCGMQGMQDLGEGDARARSEGEVGAEMEEVRRLDRMRFGLIDQDGTGGNDGTDMVAHVGLFLPVLRTPDGIDAGGSGGHRTREGNGVAAVGDGREEQFGGGDEPGTRQWRMYQRDEEMRIGAASAGEECGRRQGGRERKSLAPGKDDLGEETSRERIVEQAEGRGIVSTAVGGRAVGGAGERRKRGWRKRDAAEDVGADEDGGALLRRMEWSEEETRMGRGRAGRDDSGQSVLRHEEGVGTVGQSEICERLVHRSVRLLLTR